MIKHSGKHLLFIINDLLDSNQIQNGKLRLNYEYFKIGECIQSVVDFLVFQARERNVEINFINKINCEGQVRSDPNRIKQVLVNLIGNALKFTEKGRIDIIAECHSQNSENTYFQSSRDLQRLEKCFFISVKDTGCGISHEDISNLFNDFVTIRNDTTIRLNKNGIGLGLAISQKIIEALNQHRKDAKIKVKSILGQGSEFYFPIYSMEEESLRSMNSKDNIPGSSKGYDIVISSKEIQTGQVKSQEFSFLPSSAQKSILRRILIVDDDHINLIVLSHYLMKWENCLVEKCNNGLEAIKKIKHHALESLYFDAVILDNKMPVMDGIEAAGAIKKLVRDGFINELTIIGASGDISSADEFKRAGADDHITKPFSNLDLFIVLNKYLGPRNN